MVKVKRLRLKPSARDKRRYFLVSVGNDKVEKAILDSLGALGMAKAAYMKVKSVGRKTVGSCLRESLNNVRAALSSDDINIEKVSGTIKGLKV
tara:strand:+ start:236 stop:514 length:279 start_codon:yes stop_codon:yes gene_type:complete